jgi:hypothetical protein
MTAIFRKRRRPLELPRGSDVARLRSLSYGGQVALPTLLNQFSNSNVVIDMASRSRRAIRASLAGNIPPFEIRGRRECRAADAPVARVHW